MRSIGFGTIQCPGNRGALRGNAGRAPRDGLGKRARRGTLGSALLALFTALAPAAGAPAATYQVSAGAEGCSNTVSGPTPIGTASLCPGSTGRATPGSVGVRAEASISRTLDGPFPDTSLSRAAATARFTDILSIGIESGSLTIPLDFASNVLFETQGALFTDTFVLFQGTLSGAGTSSGFSYGISQAGDSDVRTALGVPRFVRDVTFEFDGGSLALASSLSVTADCGTPRPEGGSCILDADALASLRFLGATLRDETGALRDDVAITSTSGFDYRAGVEPHAAIPLPATAALLLSGLAGLVLLGRDRRSASVAA